MIGLWIELTKCSDIDADITQKERDRINKLLHKETSPLAKTQLHESLIPIPEPEFSDLMRKEIARLAAGLPRQGGIDTSRYEAPDEPSGDTDIDTWKTALQNAYISSAYLHGRRTNLSLLEEFGKNAWLIGNSQLETDLKTLETELSGLKTQIEEVNRARKLGQEGSRGELLGLEDTWKKGIGKIIEVQLATDELHETLSQQRRSAIS